nr:hypothetical protein DEQ67_14615 [Haloferax sp. Atlit-48N]
MVSRAHQKGVNTTAEEHDRNGWNVKAALRGWTQPPTIAGHIPDVVATKRGSRRVIEIETSRNDQKRQHEAFRRHAGQKANTVFIGYVVDSAGRRIDQFR